MRRLSTGHRYYQGLWWVGLGRIGFSRGCNDFRRCGRLRPCVLYLLLQRGDLRLRRRLLGLHLSLQGLDRCLKLIRIGGIGAARSGSKNCNSARAHEQIAVDYPQSPVHDPSPSSIMKSRSRLGSAPLRKL